MSSWYHCSGKPVSRSAGRSVVPAAAYRIGDRLYDERPQTLHDYRRRGGVEASFIIAPANAPDWASDPAHLWNAAEAAENRSNSRTAREVELALPSGVSEKEREQITRDFAEHLAERYGVAVMVALHEPSKHGDERNHHAHILMTTRRMNADGLGNKTRELDDQKTGKLEILHIREYAADLINEVLEKTGSDERIDHRSYKDRGIDQTPTEHLGVEAAAMERRGEKSRIGDRNREIKEAAHSLDNLTQEREELNRQIEETQTQQRDIAPEKTSKTEPTKGRSATYWQERIQAERDREDDDEDSNRPVDPRSIDHQAHASIFNDPNLKQHKAQILKTGAIKHHGLIGKWYEQAAEWVHELREGISGVIDRFTGTNEPDRTPSNTLDKIRRAEAWERFISPLDSDPEPDRTQDNDRER